MKYSFAAILLLTSLNLFSQSQCSLVEGDYDCHGGMGNYVVTSTPTGYVIDDEDGPAYQIDGQEHFVPKGPDADWDLYYQSHCSNGHLTIRFREGGSTEPSGDQFYIPHDGVIDTFWRDIDGNISGKVCNLVTKELISKK